MMYAPHPRNGTKIESGDAVVSKIHASFSLDTFILSVSGCTIGPAMIGLPISEKKTMIPANHPAICAFALVLTNFVTDAAKACAPPDTSNNLTNPPIKINKISTSAQYESTIFGTKWSITYDIMAVTGFPPDIISRPAKAPTKRAIEMFLSHIASIMVSTIGSNDKIP